MIIVYCSAYIKCEKSQDAEMTGLTQRLIYYLWLEWKWPHRPIGSGTVKRCGLVGSVWGFQTLRPDSHSLTAAWSMCRALTYPSSTMCPCMFPSFQSWQRTKLLNYKPALIKSFHLKELLGPWFLFTVIIETLTKILLTTLKLRSDHSCEHQAACL